MEKRECTRLIAAICAIISTLPTDQLSGHLNTLAGSRVEQLEQLAQQQVLFTTCSLCPVLYRIVDAQNVYFVSQPSPVSHPLVDLEVSLIGTLCHFVNPKSLQNEEQHVVNTLVVNGNITFSVDVANHDMLRVWPSLKILVLQWCQDEITVDVSQNEELIVH